MGTYYKVKDLIRELELYDEDSIVQIIVNGTERSESVREVVGVISMRDLVDSKGEEIRTDMRDINTIAYGIGSPESNQEITDDDIVEELRDEYMRASNRTRRPEQITFDICLYLVTSVSARIPSKHEDMASRSV